MGAGVSMFFNFGDSVKKNEKQSSYVSLRDLLEKDQTSLSVTPFLPSTTMTTSPTKTKIGGCGTYTTVEVYDKLNLEDEKLSSPSFVSPYLNYPNHFSGEDGNKEYVFDKITSKSPAREGPKEKNNNNPLPQVEGVFEIEDTMVEKVLTGRMSFDNLKVMLLEVMAMLKTNGRLRVHIVLEQVNSQNEEKDNKSSKGKSEPNDKKV